MISFYALTECRSCSLFFIKFFYTHLPLPILPLLHSILDVMQFHARFSVYGNHSSIHSTHLFMMLSHALQTVCNHPCVCYRTSPPPLLRSLHGHILLLFFYFLCGWEIDSAVEEDQRGMALACITIYQLISIRCWYRRSGKWIRTLGGYLF